MTRKAFDSSGVKGSVEWKSGKNRDKLKRIIRNFPLFGKTQVSFALRYFLFSSLIVLLFPAVSYEADIPPSGQNEIPYSFTLWQGEGVTYWEDFNDFKNRIEKCRNIGFNLIEMSIPWLETEEDFNKADERINHVLDQGLRLRLRVVLIIPKDYEPSPEFMTRWDGTPFKYFTSFFNENNRRIQMEYLDRIVTRYKGHGIQYTPYMSTHSECKYGGWWSFEKSAVDGFRNWLKKKYNNIEELNRNWRKKYKDFIQVRALIPPQTFSWNPDIDVSNSDWIEFREEILNGIFSDFSRHVKENDATAVVSVPLGESFRSGSAEMGNQDYYNLARNADNVVHSYDFFCHPREEIWSVAATMDTFIGITNKPVTLEIDGPSTYKKYGDDGMYKVGVVALNQGSVGLNVCNYGKLADFDLPFMRKLAKYIEDNKELLKKRREEPEIIMYVSKWTQYLYRDINEWIHEYQYGFYKALYDLNIPVRIITDENILNEDLSGYKCLILPYNVVIDEPVRIRLKELLKNMQAIQDFRCGEYTRSGKSPDGWFNREFGMELSKWKRAKKITVVNNMILRSFQEEESLPVLRDMWTPKNISVIIPGEGSIACGKVKRDDVIVLKTAPPYKATLGYNFGHNMLQPGHKKHVRLLKDILRWMGISLPQ